MVTQSRSLVAWEGEAEAGKEEGERVTKAPKKPLGSRATFTVLIVKMVS
jgi:hypothetical protein